jgi:hypothetical protein
MHHHYFQIHLLIQLFENIHQLFELLNIHMLNHQDDKQEHY